MYESYWQLKQKPFENCLDPRFYWPGESHQAALLKLRYALENRRGGALLAGLAGSGKTLVAQMLRGALSEDFQPVVHLVFPQMATDELLAYLADGLEGASPSPATRVDVSVRRVERFLMENLSRGRHAVVIADEAHLIDDPHTLEALRLLMNFEANGQPAMTLLLCGQPAILPTLDRTPALEERLAVKCLLRPFTQQETADYVSHRLKVAGAVREIIAPDALPTLHILTHGIARRINRLCDLALLIGYAEERQTLTAEHFEAVCQELVTVAPE